VANSKRDVYIAIMRAAERGVGLRLDADECLALSMDDAIATAALNGLSEEEVSKFDGDSYFWANVSTRTRKKPHNVMARED